MGSKSDDRSLLCPLAACGVLLGAVVACASANTVRHDAQAAPCCSYAAQETVQGVSASASVVKAGDPLRPGAVRVPLSEALAHPEAYQGKVVRLEGTVEQVCPRRGCWLLLRDGDARARVTFKDYGFFVPTDCRGKSVRLDAEVTRSTISEELAAHLESETEGGDPQAVQGPQEIVSVVATGVEIGDAEAPK